MKKTQKAIIFLTLVSVLFLGSLSAETTWKDNDKERASDIWIKSKLVTIYTLNEYLNPFKLDVDVDDRVVTLGGSVDSDIEKDLAVEIARGVEDVKEVRDEISVEPDKVRSREEASEESLFFRNVKDATITAKVKARLLWNSNTEGLNINVDTENRVVALKGSVESEIEKDLAEQIAKNTKDVRRVDNNLNIDKNVKKNGEKKEKDKFSGKVTDAWITAKINTILLFSKEADNSDVDVSTEDGVVTLKGTVVSDKQKKNLISLVTSSSQVKSVKDKLEVRQEKM